MPPNLSNIHIEITQSPNQPHTAQRSNLNSLGGYHPAPIPSTTAAHNSSMVPIATSHHPSSLGGYTSATIATKRRHTDPAQDDNNSSPTDQPKTTARRKSKSAPTKRHRTRCHTKNAPAKASPEHPFPPIPIDNPPHYPTYLDSSAPQHLTPQEVELARAQLQNRIQLWHRKNGNNRTHPQPQPHHRTTTDQPPMDSKTANPAPRTKKHYLPGESSPIIIESRTTTPTSPAYDHNSPTNNNIAATTPTSKPRSLGGYTHRIRY